MLQKIKSFTKGLLEKLPENLKLRLKPFAALVLAFSIFMAVVLLSTNTVRVTDGTNTYVVSTLFGTLQTAMKKINFESEYKIIETTKKLFGTDVTISYLFPITVTVGDKTETYKVSPDTLGNILSGLGISLDENDIVSPSLDSFISSETYVDIVRVEFKTETYSEDIPFGTTVEYSNKYDTTTNKVVSNGEVGSKIVTCSVKYVNGVATEKTVVSEEVVKEAVDKKTVIGTRAPQYLSASSVKTISTLSAPSSLKLDKNGVPVNYSSVKTLTATAYTHTGNNCSTGVKPQPGYIAVDPKEIPYGTKMYIVSADGKYVYGYAIAADTGGFIYGNRVDVDLFFDTEAQCVKFGIRDVKVYFLN